MQRRTIDICHTQYKIHFTILSTHITLQNTGRGRLLISADIYALRKREGLENAFYISQRIDDHDDANVDDNDLYISKACVSVFHRRAVGGSIHQGKPCALPASGLSSLI